MEPDEPYSKDDRHQRTPPHEKDLAIHRFVSKSLFPERKGYSKEAMVAFHYALIGEKQMNVLQLHSSHLLGCLIIRVILMVVDRIVAPRMKQLKFSFTFSLGVMTLGGGLLELLEIYILNLLITVAMFLVLILRAWIEFKNYRIMWKELEWRRTYEVVGRVLKAEKDLFTGVEGGEELYNLLCEMFKVNNRK